MARISSPDIAAGATARPEARRRRSLILNLILSLRPGQWTKNLLVFAQFRPATAFGRPTSGHLVLSFARINVKG